MPPNLDAPLPLEALRDLIGVVRALYAAWKTNRANVLDLEELASIGKDLSAALKLAQRTPPNTLGHRAAWSRAEDATKRLGHLVGKLESLHSTLEAATARVVGRAAPRAELSEREAKKKHVRMRS